MLTEECCEFVTVHGYGELIRECRCPICHGPVRITDWTSCAWICGGCGVFGMGFPEFRYYDPKTETEIEELREEYEYICEADA